MLVLSRKKNESIIIDENIVITVVEVRGDKVRLGIQAPREVPIHSAAKVYAPRRMVFAINRNTDDLPGALAERKASADGTIAYRCVGTHCELPVTTWEALAEQLSETSD